MKRMRKSILAVSVVAAMTSQVAMAETDAERVKRLEAMVEQSDRRVRVPRAVRSVSICLARRRRGSCVRGVVCARACVCGGRVAGFTFPRDWLHRIADKPSGIARARRCH